MSRLSTFFGDKDVEVGVFYPNHCLLAAFENLADADSAKEKLAYAGFVGESVISYRVRTSSFSPKITCSKMGSGEF